MPLNSDATTLGLQEHTGNVEQSPIANGNCNLLATAIQSAASSLTGKLSKSANLSDLNNVGTARTNLGFNDTNISGQDPSNSNAVSTLRTIFSNLWTAIVARATKDELVLGWVGVDNCQIVSSASYDSNQTLLSCNVRWPDGTTGTYVADTLSTSFPGETDAWHYTRTVGAVTKTYTQTALTRDASGNITATPVIVVS